MDPDLNHDLELGILVPPQAVEAESSLLGAVLLDSRVFEMVADQISERDFYRQSHRQIFAAISSLDYRSKPIDVVTVFEELSRTGLSDDVGGLQYLNALAQFVPNASNVRRYAELVKEKAVLRAIVSASEETIRDVLDGTSRNAADALDCAERRVLAVGDVAVRKGEVKSLADQLNHTIEWLQKKADSPNEPTGLQTGFIELDRSIAGLQPGDLIVIAARPSMGKTALAMNIAEHSAIAQNKRVLVISLEMSAEQLNRRMLGSVGRIDQQRLKNATLEHGEWARVSETVERLRGKVLDVYDEASLTINNIRAVSRRIAKKHRGLDLIVVDYLQLLEGIQSDRPENRATEVAQISRGLKLLAKELQCPLIALSQLNRSVEQRSDKRPLMSDLRESGAIEQDADVIMFIYRDEYYTKDTCKEPGIAEVIIAKHRNGPTGTVNLNWRANLARFDNL